MANSGKTQSVSMYVITAGFSYGPYPTKAEADKAYNSVKSVPNSTLSKITKGARGFTFTAKTKFGAVGASEKSKAVSEIKRNAPTAKVTVSGGPKKKPATWI